MQQLDERLHEGGYRILTIHGPGGIGKTRLAVEVARRQLNRFPHGVFFVPLAGVDQVDEIPVAIARAMRLALNERDVPAEQVLRALAEQRLLLVLDNVEHLVEVASWLLELVVHAPHLRLLVTSRERLNVMAEDLFHIDGLPVPPPGADDGRARHAPSVHLFVDRAHRLDKSFMLNQENVQAVVQVCRLVEGLPLGIELAATWIQELTCQQIASHIAQPGLSCLRSARPAATAAQPARRLRSFLEAAFCGGADRSGATVAFSWPLWSRGGRRGSGRDAACD